MPLSNSTPLVLGVQRYELFYKFDLKAASNQIILAVLKDKRKSPAQAGLLRSVMRINYSILVTLAAPVLLVFTLVGLPRYLISAAPVVFTLRSFNTLMVHSLAPVVSIS
jgi:hypothetical protein